MSVVATQALVAAARAAAEALGIRNGPTYTQIRVGEDGPRVVELAARLGGGHDAELCELATGVSLNDLALDFALGREPSVAPTQSRFGGACVLFLVAPEGELRAVEGVEEAEAVEGDRRGSDLPRARAGASGRSCAAPTGPARSSRPARAVTTRSSALAGRPAQYASTVT